MELHNLDSESPSPKRKGGQDSQYLLVKAQQELNLNAIRQLRIDFITFKSHVLAQLVEQRDMVARIAGEMSAKMNVWRMQEGYNKPNVNGKQEKRENIEVLEGVDAHFDRF